MAAARREGEGNRDFGKAIQKLEELVLLTCKCERADCMKQDQRGQAEKTRFFYQRKQSILPNRMRECYQF
ncbi:MAG: hypothetical protein EBX52_02730 [Proteobacteria bacterium]|nr:hypothetical protein [Pseudomonadota bacterium]